MKKISFFVFLLVGLVPISHAQKTVTYNSLIQRLAADFPTPGVAVAVLNDSEVKEFTYGVSNFESKRPITNNTLFNVASISKLVTAHAVVQLAEQKRIDLDKPIEDYLKTWRFPKSGFDSKLVTTRLVLNHSAGLTSEFGPGFTKADKLLPLTDVLSGKSAKRRSLRIVNRPGARHVYSNLGYGLLQLLVEDVTDKPFEEYVSESVFRRLEMRSSSFGDPILLGQSNDLATPHDFRMSPLKQERFVVVAAAGLFSNLRDLEKLLLEETIIQELLEKSSFDQMHMSDSDKSYGLGHMIYKDDHQVRFIGHTGLGMGWNSSFQFAPGSDDGIIVLTNGDNGFYVHNTLTCFWYYSQTGKRTETCKVAPDKKLNGIALFMEISREKGHLDKARYDEFAASLKESRMSLKAGEFERFSIQLKKLQTNLKESIKDPKIQTNLDRVFESCFYWMNMPWFGLNGAS